MKKLKIIILLLCVSFNVHSQEAVMKKYAADIDQAEMKEILSILASDALEGRETGERGQKMAASFIADYFQKIGLHPVIATKGGMSYYQKFNLESSKFEESYLKVGNQLFSDGEELLYFGQANIPTPIRGKTVYAGNGTDEEFALINAKGNIVVLNEPPNFSKQWKALISKGYKYGASLVIIITKKKSKDFKVLTDRFKRTSLGFKNKNRKENGAFIVSYSIAATLLNSTIDKINKATMNKKLEKIKGDSIEFLVTRKIKTLETENILGFLEGTDKKDEVIIITAHYDHIGKNGAEINNGADDDASGTTAVLKVASAFSKAKKEGYAPRRSILFMTVTGEEKGLLGSEYYVNNPVFPLRKTEVNLNIDMIGRVDKQHTANRKFVYLVGSDKLSSELHTLSEGVNNSFTKLSLDYTYNDENHPDRIYYRSDHWNFAKNNIPVIFYFNGIHADYHKPSDTVDKIEFDLLKERAQLIFYTAWVLANRNERLVLDKMK